MTESSDRHAAASAAPVSFDDEPLVLVDEQDRPLGHLDKRSCHDGEGRLHRAFSVFVLNGDGEVLMQQRSADKRLWPLYWSNACCSHPRRGEAMEDAVARRLAEELSLTVPVRFLYKFQYVAPFGSLGTERELCWVYAGITDRQPEVNPLEIAAWRWLPRQALEAEMTHAPANFTPWSIMEWQRIRRDVDLQSLPNNRTLKRS